jgi:hypothetical protein
MISPWYGAGVTATTFGVSAVVGLVVVQWLSAGVDGFLTGRLRTKWVSVHTHEVFFRDTAHGFLAWSLATVAGAPIFASVTASGVSGAAHETTEAAVAAGQHADTSGGQGSAYLVDTLFRSNNPADGNKCESEADTGHILAKSIQGGQIVLSPGHKAYIAQTVAARTGIPQADAEQRVDTAVAQINDASAKRAKLRIWLASGARSFQSSRHWRCSSVRSSRARQPLWAVAIATNTNERRSDPRMRPGAPSRAHLSGSVLRPGPTHTMRDVQRSEGLPSMASYSTAIAVHRSAIRRARSR